MNTKIISITTNLSRYGGAQKVLIDVHNGLKPHLNCFITGFQDFQDLHTKYNISKNEYVKFNPWILKNNIILVHARNIIPFIVMINKLLSLNAKIIYISHNVYNTHKLLTLFPKNIISISEKVTQNLLEYFKIKNKNITLIYNGIKDTYNPNTIKRKYKEDGKIKILYPARINNVKRQIEIVENLKNKLLPNIEIYFAGIGNNYEKLRKSCEDDNNFYSLGFLENLEQNIVDYDYVMLYSSQEGLPISLIEGIMNKKPLIINDVGGNLEIGKPNENALKLEEDWQNLHVQINKLDKISAEEYYAMSEKSRNIFLEKFRYEIMIEKYLNLIKNI